MTIDSYGGNPDIVATRAEIHRVAHEIKLAAEQLSALGSIESLLSNPLHQLQFRVATVSVLAKLEKLYGSCLVAADQYFSTEAQINRRFEIPFIPELAMATTNLGAAMGWNLTKDVAATKTNTFPAKAPSSITEMLDRLWQLSSRTKPTVGVDFFRVEGNNRTVVVYVPGTQTLDLGGGSNPLDMQSNILAMADNGIAGSELAVLEAMHQAGVKSDDNVIFVGHSQGGMVAGNLAQNPTGYIAAGLVTIGAPLAQLQLTKIPVMAIEHVNDPVPNISGRVNPIAKNWVTVQRTALPTESEAPMYSHSLKSYKNTTEKVDSSKSKGVVNVRDQILSQLRSSPVGKALDFVIAREF